MCHVAYLYVQSNEIYSPQYYSAGAGHSVALNQFSPSSYIQELMRKEIYLLTKTCYAKHI